MLQAVVIPAARLAYLKASVISAAKLCSSQGSCNISNTTSQESEVEKLFLSFEVTATGITESTTKLLKGFGINVAFGSENQYCNVCGEFNFG
jgi:hypothetical protein